jgi:uroporphyrinogen decarboxylase
LNLRNRFLEVARFGNPDKVPLSLWGIRPATLRRWWKEGLPPGMDAATYFRFDIYGMKTFNIASWPSEGFPWEPSDRLVNLGPIPPFEYRILREDDRYRVWVDSLGITQLGFQDDWKDGWSGFATRTFVDFPVKNRYDFERIKDRYDPHHPDRYPPRWKETVKTLKEMNDGSFLIHLSLRGAFWWTRDMMGLEATLISFFKDKQLIQDILDLYLDFHIETLRRAVEEVEVDYVTLNEDMAYKRGPMISLRMFREYLSPVYRELISFLRNHGVKVVIVDSDGYVEPLIPELLSVGVDGISPCEVAAGMDIVELRRKYPKLVMMGGIDKRMLASSKSDIDREVYRKVPPLIKSRGYFPGVDHAVPPDVSFENFSYFLELLKKLCGWID